jgi:hypothetical protein
MSEPVTSWSVFYPQNVKVSDMTDMFYAEGRDWVDLGQDANGYHRIGFPTRNGKQAIAYTNANLHTELDGVVLFIKHPL